jgi:hypothetical protein
MALDASHRHIRQARIGEDGSEFTEFVLESIGRLHGREGTPGLDFTCPTADGMIHQCVVVEVEWRLTLALGAQAFSEAAICEK